MRWLLALALLPALVFGADKKKKGDPKPMPMPVLVKLTWLTGSWRQEKSGRVTEEHWLGPAGGAMLGVSRTIAKGRELEHEFMQIREGPGGDLFFIAHPTGQKEAAFKLLSLSDTEVVFENKEHDFPQTISYALQADGTVLAAIEGLTADGKTKRVEFLYQPQNNPNP
jgi:hypothetical protein